MSGRYLHIDVCNERKNREMTRQQHLKHSQPAPNCALNRCDGPERCVKKNLVCEPHGRRPGRPCKKQSKDQKSDPDSQVLAATGPKVGPKVLLRTARGDNQCEEGETVSVRRERQSVWGRRDNQCALLLKASTQNHRFRWSSEMVVGSG